MNIKHFFYWGGAGVALFALADPFPDLATMLVVIIMVGVLLRHWKDYASYINAAAPANAKTKA